jgi:hypothetical protein
MGWDDDGDARVIVHVAEFRADGATADQEDDLIEAISNVNYEFNKTAGTTAGTHSLQRSTVPFDFGTAFGDADPTIHIGFEDDPAYEGQEKYVGSPTTETVDDKTICKYTEAHIRFNKLSTTPWNFGTPGDLYFKTGLHDYLGQPYFRQLYLHELLHAYGLTHADSSYSFLNYGDHPWANRPATESIRPLPDEIRWLRRKYPEASTRADVAVLNTWYDADDVTDENAALGKLLCEPSRGRVTRTRSRRGAATSAQRPSTSVKGSG